MSEGAIPGSRPTGQAAARLDASRFDPGRVRCAGCGKFIAYAEMDTGGGAKFEFTPLNEFGPEESEWVCARCVEKERNQ